MTNDVATLPALAQGFDRVARPRHGRYVDEPALTDETGVVALPPAKAIPGMSAAIGAAVALGVVLGARPSRDR